MKSQAKKAERFLALHHDAKLLVLPNIWDPLGARLLQHLEFPAVATASAAVSFSLGYDDGQHVTFAAMLDVIRRVAAAVDIPVTADIERGYGETPTAIADNVREVVRAGVVGINIEDSIGEGGPLLPVNEQCERIRAIRRMADREGIPLVINARTDGFLFRTRETKSEILEETIERGRAYLSAGADCLYPITAGDLETLSAIRGALDCPLNVYATVGAAPMRDLEDAGISRLSLGPWLLKTSLTAMKRVALSLKEYGPFELFTGDAIANDEVRAIVSHDDMPPHSRG